MKQKILSLLLSLCMLLSLLPAGAVTARAAGDSGYAGDAALLLDPFTVKVQVADALTGIAIDDLVLTVQEGEEAVVVWNDAEDVHEVDLTPGAYTLTVKEVPWIDSYSSESIPFTVGEDGSVTTTADAAVVTADGVLLVKLVPVHKDHLGPVVVHSPWSSNDCYYVIPRSSGTYYLALDSNWIDPWNLDDGQNIQLCLNGRSLRMEQNSAIRIDLDSELTLYDATRISGRLVGASPQRIGCLVWVSGGTFTMNGGRITDTTSSVGLLEIDPIGTFTMNGGSITGNTAMNVVDLHGAFTMNGGSITGNTAKKVVDMKENSTFTMNGGSITGNTVEEGGVHVLWGYPTFLVSGSPVVTGNTNSAGKACNIMLYNYNWKVKMSTIRFAGPLTADAKLGVTAIPAPAEGLPVTITTGLNGNGTNPNGTVENFISDDPQYAVRLNSDGEAELYVPTIEAQVFSHTLTQEGQTGIHTYLILSDTITGAPENYQVEYWNGDTLAASQKVSEVQAVSGTMGEVTYTVYDFTVTTDAGEMDPAVYTMKIKGPDGYLDFADSDGKAINGDAGLSCAVTENGTEPGGGFTPVDLGGGSSAPSVPSVGGGSGGGGSGGDGGSAAAVYTVTTPAVSSGAVIHGTVTADRKNHAANGKVTLTVRPDEGYRLEQLTVTDAKGNIVPVAGNADGTYRFTMPESAVRVDPVFVEAGAPSASRFADVPGDAYYSDAVNWAVEKAVTNGTDETHFSPNAVCTRAQTVTFLWRAAGGPESAVTAAQFRDVKAGSYYEKAVAWAAENGITNGVSETVFDPDGTVTRAQTVAFLFRYAKASAEATDAFADVSPDAWYAQAVAWAVEQGVTKGVDAARFAPNAPCVRAQIVTFLHRLMGQA